MNLQYGSINNVSYASGVNDVDEMKMEICGGIILVIVLSTKKVSVHMTIHIYDTLLFTLTLYWLQHKLYVNRLREFRSITLFSISI